MLPNVGGLSAAQRPPRVGRNQREAPHRHHARILENVGNLYEIGPCYAVDTAILPGVLVWFAVVTAHVQVSDHTASKMAQSPLA